ncbi:MAG: glycosyltransferase family 2 protein [Gammaproteobacteria bacterium]|nr:glycosyltransferase family 2 protein [Gammaproteobacteria bacterium]
MKKKLSIILPCRNEAAALPKLLHEVRRVCPDAEIIVADDGSNDASARISAQAGVRLVTHPYSIGNGAAIKHGARNGNGEIFVFMDADGQHEPKDISRLVEKLEGGYDMVVGARNAASHASFARLCANIFYNRLASWVVGHPVADLTSGFRAVRAAKFKEFTQLLPNGFSYPTTITIAFFRAGYPVAYVPVQAYKRKGKSHIKPLRDGIRFLLIIFKIGTLYSPLKLFGPLSLIFFFLGGGHYFYTFITMGRFTNMSALLFTTSLLIFLIGLVSEQITHLIYTRNDDRR